MSTLAAFLLIAVLLMVFLLAAIILLAVVPSHMNKKQAQCTLAVPAVIVDMVAEWNGGSFNHASEPPNYAPVYEFIYNGVTYRKKSVLNSSKRPTVGEQRILMVDPCNLDRFFDPQEYKRARLIFKIVGGAMLAMALCIAVVGVFVIWALR